MSEINLWNRNRRSNCGGHSSSVDVGGCGVEAGPAAQAASRLVFQACACSRMQQSPCPGLLVSQNLIHLLCVLRLERLNPASLLDGGAHDCSSQLGSSSSADTMQATLSSKAAIACRPAVAAKPAGRRAM